MKRRGPRSWKNEPVSQEELTAFREKVQAMADAEFGVDDEGDSTVEVRLTDRTHGRYGGFMQLPYEDYLEEATFNLRCAFGDWDTAVRREDFRKHMAREGKK